MPLPANNTPWPPREVADLLPDLRAWSAWYSGDPHQLRDAYQRDVARPSTRPSQYAGGVVGAVARFWWGRPNHDLSAQRGQLHVPIAADLCQASADLLFSEPPTITVKDTTTQSRVAELVDDGLHGALAEGAEVAAALGGVYQRVTWDRQLLDRPFLTTVHADAALPEFRWGRLSAVTFWRVVRKDGQRVWRHLERHELDGQGVGVILHGLYEGTTNNLGRPVPLVEVTELAPLAELVDADSTISTGSPGLAVEYVPNQRPHRRWRTHPLGTHFGRSDLDGVEGFMDALDEAWSSWMRDLRLGKARIIAAQSMLDAGGPGQGAWFDADREIFTPVQAMVRGDQSVADALTPVQFAIRVEEHARTTQELTEVILRSAGYSAETFGEGSDAGGDVTAAEVHAKQRRSFLTRDRKVRTYRPSTTRSVAKLLEVDAAIFGRPRPNLDGLLVSFGDSIQEAPEAIARTAELLRRARAASTRTLVQMAHPEWDDQQVDTEVAAIHGEDAVPDAASFVPPGADPAVP